MLPLKLDLCPFYGRQPTILRFCFVLKSRVLYVKIILSIKIILCLIALFWVVKNEHLPIVHSFARLNTWSWLLFFDRNCVLSGYWTVRYGIDQVLKKISLKRATHRFIVTHASWMFVQNIVKSNDSSDNTDSILLNRNSSTLIEYCTTSVNLYKFLFSS